MTLSPSQVIVLATPVFLLAIAAEFAWGRRRGRDTYRLDDAISSIGLGMLSQVAAVLMPLLTIGIYTAVHDQLAVVRADAFWTSWYGWLLALVFYDLCYYWLHRAGHEVALLWAAHVVHHQSQDYNLSTALRQTATGPLLAWVFYLPMALAGVPPLVFGVVALVDLLYQFWVHTEHVGKLGWFDRWFCSPSNHRVHHAVNDAYVDRNYGGILIVWDRLFGTFREEDEPCVYGTRSALDSWDPLWANGEVYVGLAQDAWRARRWRDKLRVWFARPGWRPADVAQRFPKPAFDIAKVRRYQPPLTRDVAWFGAIGFVLLLAGVALFLWHADGMPLAQAVVWLAALTASLWALTAVLQGRLTLLQGLLVQAGALATATSAVGLIDAHRVFKPLAMLLAIAFVLRHRRGDRLLLCAMALSLVGDVFMMYPGATMFTAGLACFLVVNVIYTLMWRRDVPWLPHRSTLGATLLLAALVCAALFPFLDAAMKVAVPAYSIALAVMAAQAIGRAQVLRTPDATAVGVGAGLFIVADIVMAVNRFVAPLPLAQLVVLGCYYAAQVLFVHNARAVRVAQPRSSHAEADEQAGLQTPAG